MYGYSLPRSLLQKGRQADDTATDEPVCAASVGGVVHAPLGLSHTRGMCQDEQKRLTLWLARCGAFSFIELSRRRRGLDEGTQILQLATDTLEFL